MASDNRKTVEAKAKAMFDSIKEVLSSMSSSDVFGMQLLTSLDDDFKNAPMSVKTAMVSMATEYDARRALIK